MSSKRGHMQAGAVAKAVSLGAAVGSLAWTTNRRIRPVQPHPAQATDYATAMDRFGQLQRGDGADVHPRCHSTLLTHGCQVEHTIVVFHGLGNCPYQFMELASRLYARGYNVLVPRMPGNGLLDRRSSVQRSLRAEDLVRYGETAMDIATGLGARVTVVGLSAGGTVAAWLAQYRTATARAVLLAPMFGIGGRYPGWLSVVGMHLALTIPHISTEWFAPFKDPPAHSSLGFSTRALAEVVRLGVMVRRAATHSAPAAQSIAVLTNPLDHSVNDSMAWDLAYQWWRHGLARLDVMQFPAAAGVAHDSIDPTQPYAQIDVTYPVVLRLITPESA